MIENQELLEVIKKFKHQINCLIDQDRNTRLNSLKIIKKQISNLKNSLLIKLFSNETNLVKYLLRVLNDKIQTNRQESLNIINEFINRISQQEINKEQLSHIIIILIGRINVNPFPQTSEELRLMIIRLLHKIFLQYDCFHSSVSELSNALAKCLLDPYPEIKKYTCQFMIQICIKFRTIVGHHSHSLIKSLVVNLTHQHSKVRKITLKAVGYLLVTESAATHFPLVEVALKAALNDKIGDVRLAALQCTANLLNLMAPKYLLTYQASLVSNLLTGLVDDNSINRQKCKQLLQQCGTNLYKLSQEQSTIMKPQQQQ